MPFFQNMKMLTKWENFYKEWSKNLFSSLRLTQGLEKAKW